MNNCQNKDNVEYFFYFLVDDFSEESSFYEILPCCARFRCGELIVEGQWHHLVLVMSKGMLKNSTVALYIDGQLVSTVKVSIPALGKLNLLYKIVQGVCMYVCLQGYFLNCLNFKLNSYLNNMLESYGWLVPITSLEKNEKRGYKIKN